jgi:hypothetical protein
VRAADSAPALPRGGRGVDGGVDVAGRRRGHLGEGLAEERFTAWKTGPEPFALRLGLLTS